VGDTQAAQESGVARATPGLPEPPSAPSIPAPGPDAPVLDPPAIPSATPAENEVGEIVVTAKHGHPPDDPLEAVNKLSFEVTQAVDDAVVAPIARVHAAITPKPVRRGIRNFLNNLREPVVLVNFLLQLKFGKAAETAGRFAINTTMGLGGVIDVAKRCPFNLPWRPNGFGDTLGVYGIKEGPYFYLPLLGPTTARDLAGGMVDRVLSPIALGGPFKSRAYVVGSNVYRAIDNRAEMEDELQTVRDSDDPYAAQRDLYLEKRRARVDKLRGHENAGDASRSSPQTSGDSASGSEPAPAKTMTRCRSRDSEERENPGKPAEAQR